MPRKVTTSPEFREALKDVHNRYAGPKAGARGHAIWKAVKDAPKGLKDFPNKGIEDPEQPGLRRIVAAEHRIIYRVEDNGDVRVLVLLHPGQP